MNPISPDAIKDKIKSQMSMLSGKVLVFILIGIVIMIILIFINSQNKKFENNCKAIMNFPNFGKPLKPNCVFQGPLLDTTISGLYVKTAYNCCCTGMFKNDYIDDFTQNNGLCALANCAYQGARALDFTVYSISKTASGKPTPIIAASTVIENNYKEMYNHVDFHSTMLQVKKFFLLDSNMSQISDPLFIILRVYSVNVDVYNAIAASLNETFGTGNDHGNFIYHGHLTINTKLSDIRRSRVVIIVEPYTAPGSTPKNNNSLILKSNLSSITSLILDPAEVTAPCINRVDYISSNIQNDVKNNIMLLYPAVNNNNWSNINYDSVTYGFNNKYPFIAMNFQNQDYYYKQYINQFTNNASFIRQLDYSPK